MEKNDIDSFLKIRLNQLNSAITELQLYETIGNNKLLKASYLNHDFFGFIQIPLKNSIVTRIISVIGSINSDQYLKSWKDILFENNHIKKLLEIRKRYANIRNQIVCHIPAMNDNNNISNRVEIPIDTARDDIEEIKR
ncbi:MAG: hypothetical protein GY821_17135 [Gammaproteobacteria bacterium]|nr:hypothetical protein [Gammaproteobacteria bacterium]